MRDANLIFGDNVDLTGAAGDTDFTDILDIEQINKGEGTVIWWVVRLEEDFAGGTSVQFALADSATVGGTYVEKILTEVTLLAACLEGKEWKIGVPYTTNKFWKVIGRTLGTHTGSNLVGSWLEID